MGRIAQLALAAALAAGAVPWAPTAAAQGSDWRGVDGNNVAYVRVNDGGAFEESGRGQWNQYEPNGRLWSQLEEVRRDATSVRLNDRGRRVEVVLDLRTREVRGTEPGSNRWRTYYRIVAVDTRRGRGTEGSRGPSGGSDRFPTAEDNGPRGISNWDPERGGDVDVGAIRDQRHAESRCRAKAMEMGVEWRGSWTTIGRTSVCGMSGLAWSGPRGAKDVTRDVDVGPIWGQKDAADKCQAEAKRVGGEWTGHWSTRVRNRVSSCQIRFRLR